VHVGEGEVPAIICRIRFPGNLEAAAETASAAARPGLSVGS